MGYFLSLCSPNASWVFAAKKRMFYFIWPQKPVSFEVPVVSNNWICWIYAEYDFGWTRIIFLETLPNNMWCRCGLKLCNILCWLEILYYCPDLTALALFLKPLISNLILFLKAQLLFTAHHTYILCFFSFWWMIKGIWALFSLLFIFLWNRRPWLDHFMFIITLECSKLWIWMGIFIRISRGFNNYVQRLFEKNIYFILISTPPPPPPIFNSYYPMKG